MTERGRAAVTREPETFRVGPSALAWQDDGTLLITLDEIGAPIPRRVRGTIRVTPAVQPQTAFALDDGARHLWQPIAPVARIAVALDRPDLAWHGSAYLDSNRGDEPLEDGFQSWTWSRAHVADGCVVLYDSLARDGTARSMALGCSVDGPIAALPSPPEKALPGTLWRIPRTTRTDGGSTCTVEQTLEDTPFYARSLLRTTLYGEPVQAFHESLSLDRFRAPIVRAMLPFRMPRRWGGG
jgi:carotenoid 1,2-hydratase